MAESMIARFRQQQALEEQAAWQGLHGLAIVASHASIIKRMELGAEHFFRLVEQGKHKEAEALMLSDDPWSVGEHNESYGKNKEK